MAKRSDQHASATEVAASGGDGRKPWLAYANLRFEAGLFLLLVVTFAAVLGKSALTTQTLAFSPQSGRFAGYAFSDAENGGHSVAAADPARPLAWSCRIRAGVSYPYCGYGLQLDLDRGQTGLDFSRLQTVTLRLTYHGTAERLRLSLKTSPPPSLRDRLGDELVPLAADFPVVQGRNEIRLPLSRLTPEQWWVTSHALAPGEVTPFLEQVHVASITTSDAKAPSDLAVSVQDIAFTGTHLSAEQFYLIILGAWLALTGSFLALRVFRMRRTFEAQQRRQAREAAVLADAHAAAQAASNAKSRFLGNMSHELRTPLNAVIGYAYWLGRTDLAPKQRDAVNAIQASGEHLLAMISDILDIAKIEAGRFELLAAPFDLRDCVAGVGEMFRLPAEEKGLAFTVEVAAEVPDAIVADRKRLRQVLINLLGNAVKFTERGTVALRVLAAGRSDAAARLRFEVEDTGVGVAADQLDAIFRPFEQAGDGASRSGGTGLGLSITRQIVEMMDGVLEVESQPGRGSRFTVEVTIPVAAAAAPKTAPPLPRSRRPVA